MRYKPLQSVTDANFELVREYINTGSSKALDEDHKKTLELCIYCYGLLREFPQRNICIRKLMALKNLPYTTAARYVDFTRQTWGNYIDFKRDFLETFFLDKLISEISSPNSTEAIRAKNLATLQKYLESMPESNIDPHLTESNNVYIQVNVGNKSFNLPEKVMNALPMEIRQQILNAFNDEVDDDGAVALLES